MQLRLEGSSNGKKGVAHRRFIEDVSHYGRSLAIYLQKKGYIVKEVNSALSYMERMSYASTKKNDSWDAQC